MAIRRGDKNGVDKGHQVSHDFWGRQNCSSPPSPITHTIYATEGDEFFTFQEEVFFAMMKSFLCCLGTFSGGGQIFKTSEGKGKYLMMIESFLCCSRCLFLAS